MRTSIRYSILLILPVVVFIVCLRLPVVSSNDQKIFLQNQKYLTSIDSPEKPQIRGISPSTVRIEGGEKIIIEGENFTEDLVIVLGDRVVSKFKFINSSKLSFRAPRQNAPGQRTLTLISSQGIAQSQVNISAKPVSELKEGEITTLMGGVPYLGDGANAINSELDSPSGMALDAQGRVYIADTLNHRIRRFDPITGNIITIVGSGACGFRGDGGLALAASLAFPTDVAFDSQQNLYILDSKNYRVRKVDSQTGVITTFAGNGIAGFSGDEALATEASLNFDVFGFSVYVAGLGSLAIDSEDNVYIADSGNERIRKVTKATAMITTVAGGGNSGIPPQNNLPALKASFSYISDIAVDSQNTLYIADYLNVYKIDNGLLRRVAGNGSSPNNCDNYEDSCVEENVLANKSPLSPKAINFDTSDNLFIFDSIGKLRKVDASSQLINTIGGNGKSGFSGDNDLAINASFGQSFEVNQSILPTSNGDILIADTTNNRVRQINNQSKTITTLVGQSVNVKLQEGMKVTEVLPQYFSAMLPRRDFFREGNFLALATNSTGEIFFSDPIHHQIWQIDSQTQTLKLKVGTGEANFSGDGGIALKATLNAPRDLTFDAQDNFYIADTDNNRVRRVDSQTSIITSVAGNGKGSDAFEYYYDDEFLEIEDDGKNALDAVLPSPLRVAVSKNGDLFVLQRDFALVREIDSENNIIGTYIGCCLNRPQFPLDTAINTKGEIGVTTAVYGTNIEFQGDSELYSFNYFEDFIYDFQGKVYFADTSRGNIIEAIDKNTNTFPATLVIGNNQVGYGQDAGKISKAQFVRPSRLALAKGFLFIFDPYATAIRVVKLPQNTSIKTQH